MSSELVNADFSRRVVIATNDLPWVPSPQAGVERRMLDRIGGEIARATSLVRYAPASMFPGHEHALGEEFLVLDGTFSDEHGDYPAGTYVRNPPGCRHSPRTGPGCTILVKLRQMPPMERRRVVVDTAKSDWEPGDVEGHARLGLYFASPRGERVTMERLGAGVDAARDPTVREARRSSCCRANWPTSTARYGPGTWIRNPAGYPAQLGVRARRDILGEAGPLWFGA